MAGEKKELKKSLGLYAVFAICTGAMFSSGFFLLPGLAYAETGPSVILAYLVASILIIPSLLSKAELSTAMPKAGGSYYFIDRALGPLAGTIGGLGIWLSLIFKSAFAFIGVGAYLGLFIDFQVIPVAIALTIGFGALNIFGAKKAAQMQNWLVAVLLSILGYYIVQGVIHLFSLDFLRVNYSQMTPFFSEGGVEFLGAVGMVFVSYMGVTKVASVAEEVRDPDRNIPLGMILSLAVTSLFYVGGVYLMVMVLPGAELSADLTPVATSAEQFFSWLPGDLGVIIIVVSAIAAFVTTGNAGIMSASRYPLALGRDHLLPSNFAAISRFKTPMVSILVTVGIMIGALLLFDVSKVAKLASSFQLLVFGIINLAVIVMRESKIWSYTPGYESPIYPWMQIFGIIASLVLIVTIGFTELVFTVGVVLLALFWYVWYSKENVEREGAIYHLFARLGKRRFDELEHELKEIMMERDLKEEDQYEEIVAQSVVKDHADRVSFENLVDEVSRDLSTKSQYSQDDLKEIILEGQHIGGISITNGTAVLEVRLSKIESPQLYLARSVHGIQLDLEDVAMETVSSDRPIDALICLVSPQQQSGQHIRLLSELVSRIEEDEFLNEWHAAEGEHELRELFMRHERFVNIKLVKDTPSEKFIDRPIQELSLPGRTMIAVIHRSGELVIPSSDEVLREGDRLMVIGNKKNIRELYNTYSGLGSIKVPD